jgi:hypothetical protein
MAQGQRMSPIATDAQYAARLITPKHAGADGEPQAVEPLEQAAEHDLPLQPGQGRAVGSNE